MEKDQEPKHMCKLCNKSFPCGRSLGGHMRSHVIYPSDHQQKLNNKKKLSSVNNGGNMNAGYGLRENPKKTCKFKDSSEDTLLRDKLCKECGKTFQSWKALFGHMKCHSDKIAQARVDEQDSWTIADQSDSETAAPNWKKRSSRKVKRYNNMVTTAATTSSSLSFNANASLSVSEIEQEQEEVAMCLIMLSKDVSHWGGLGSMGDSSDNNSEFLNAKNLVTNGGEIVKFKKLRNGKLESTIVDTQTEFGASGNLIDGCKMKKSETKFGGLSVNENLKKAKVVEELEFQVPEVNMGNNLVKETESDQKAELGRKTHHSSKRKVLDLFGPELGVNYSEIYKENFEKKTKFECASCDKAFHSYQALGGHRASHKKLKGCFGLKINGCENSSIGTEQNLSPSPSNADTNSLNIDHQVVADTSFGTNKMNKVGSHECPICFRVFSSGQALGGHKRSHLIAEAKNNQGTTSIVVQKPILEIRDFLDLNLPAPVEEEEGEDSNIYGLGFKPWWIGSSHKHEPRLGLLSN